MKLKKYELVIIGVALLAVAFTAGFFAGRSGEGKRLQISAAPGLVSQVAPSREDVPAQTASKGGEEPEAAGTVNINTADAGELTALPGIGQVLAERIIDYRAENGPFGSTEEIMRVEGIGEGKYGDIRDLIAVG